MVLSVTSCNLLVGKFANILHTLLCWYKMQHRQASSILFLGIFANVNGKYTRNNYNVGRNRLQRLNNIKKFILVI